MKLFAISTFLVLGSIAQAATIFVDCSSASQSGQAPIPNGSVNSNTCAGLLTPGGNIANTVTLFYKYDASFGFGSGNVLMNHDVSNATLNAFDNAVNQLVSDTARPFQSSITVAATAPILALLAAGNNVIIGNYSGATGSTTNVAFDYRWQIDYSPDTTVPEPSTYAMMAAGLMSFYALRRKS